MESAPVQLSAICPPRTDPTPIFEFIRGNFATELLAAAVVHFKVFDRLAARPLGFHELQRELALAARPASVLITALRAFGLLMKNSSGQFELSPLAREHLVHGSHFDVSDYIGMMGKTPGVQTMIERLVTNRPAGIKPSEPGAAFIYRKGLESAMETPDEARRLTLALAGRARNVAPLLAERLPISGNELLLDAGGGTGLYSIALLQKHPTLRAIVWDRPQVLKIAHEMAQAYGVEDRLVCKPGDMFADAVPEADLILLSNVLHDWDVPECRFLLGRFAQTLRPGGRLVIHDVFLNDDLDGPLPVALYSAALFAVTEGRAYSAAEYREWLIDAKLKPLEPIPTLVHCGALQGVKERKT